MKRIGSIELRVGHDRLLLAWSPAVVDRLKGGGRRHISLAKYLAKHENMAALRRFCAQYAPHLRLSARDIPGAARLVEAELDRGHLWAIAFTPATPASVPRLEPRHPNPAPPAPPPSASAPQLSPSQQILAARTAERVDLWPIEKRVTDVITRAIKKTPGEAKHVLEQLLSPESIALMVGLIALSVLANLTPAGWVVDVGILAFAYVAGGLVAVAAIGDLVGCVKVISTASSEHDLDEAADYLSRAAVEAGTVGLVVLLHRFAKRQGQGGGQAPKEKWTPSKEYMKPANPPKRYAKPPVEEEPPPKVPKSDEPAVKAPLLKYDVATKPNEAFFWSGRSNGVGGEQVARQIAKENGGTTLEALIEERGIKMPKWDANDPKVVAEWKQISADYANGASGEVRAVIGSSLREGNVWETAELPALKANPRVTKITQIDPATGASRVIFDRGAK